MIRSKLVIVAALAAAFLAGCSREPEAPVAMPEINNENCTPENIANAHESIRVQFGTACSRRGSFKPSSGKTW